jgi:two-component system, NarL family, nitrate/nitrite response regulator NarL
VEQRTLLFATPDPRLFERIGSQLCGEHNIQLLPQARNEVETLALVGSRQPDAALLDFVGFGQNTMTLIEKIGAMPGRTKSILFSNSWTEHSVLDALKSGSSGCLEIDGPPSELLCAIDAVRRDEIWVSRRILSIAFRQLLNRPGNDAPGLQRRLSIREREIVDWMRHGMSNKEIARKLGISDMTVKTHVHNIFHKLQISGRGRLLGMPMPGPYSGHVAPLSSRSIAAV